MSHCIPYYASITTNMLRQEAFDFQGNLASYACSDTACDGDEKECLLKILKQEKFSAQSEKNSDQRARRRKQKQRYRELPEYPDYTYPSGLDAGTYFSNQYNYYSCRDMPMLPVQQQDNDTDGSSYTTPADTISNMPMWLQTSLDSNNTTECKSYTWGIPAGAYHEGGGIPSDLNGSSMVKAGYDTMSYKEREEDARALCETQGGQFSIGACSSDYSKIRSTAGTFPMIPMVAISALNRDKKLKRACASIGTQSKCEETEKMYGQPIKKNKCIWYTERCIPDEAPVRSDIKSQFFKEHDAATTPEAKEAVREKFFDYQLVPMAMKLDTVNGVTDYFDAPLKECLKDDYAPVVRMSELQSQLKDGCIVRRMYNKYAGWVDSEVPSDPLVALSNFRLTGDMDTRGSCQDNKDCASSFTCSGASVGGYSQNFCRKAQDTPQDTTESREKTENGYECQNWASQEPHGHRYSSVGNHANCANPDNSSSDWCYTTDPAKRWDYCN